MMTTRKIIIILVIAMETMMIEFAATSAGFLTGCALAFLFGSACTWHIVLFLQARMERQLSEILGVKFNDENENG
jgi:hypothetical protein